MSLAKTFVFPRSADLKLSKRVSSRRISILALATAFGVVLAITPAAAQNRFDDPQGRYHWQVPAGWTLQVHGNAAGARSGSAFSAIVFSDLANPRAAADTVAGDFRQHWANYREIRRGESTLGGKPASAVAGVGTDEHGVVTYFRVLTVSLGSQSLMIVTTVPQKDYDSLKDAIDQVQAGISFAGASPGPTGSTSDNSSAARLKATQDAREANAQRQSGAFSAAISGDDSHKDMSPASRPPDSGNLQGNSAPAHPGSAGGGSLPGSSKSYIRMKMVRVMDQSGFGQPVEAYRMLIPSDWKMESQVLWSVQNMRCPSNAVQVNYRISSPDGAITFERFPDYAWKWYDDPMARRAQQNGSAMNMACDVAPILKATDYIAQTLLPRIRQGVRPSRGEELPDVGRDQTEFYRQVFQQMAQAGMLNGLQVVSGRVRVEYSARGQTYEETLLGNILTLSAPMQSPSAMMNGGQGMAHDYSVMTVGMYSVRAPQEQIQAANKLAGLIMATTRTNPRWEDAVRAVIQSLYAQQTQGAVDRSRIWQNYANETNQMIVQRYEKQQESQDHLARSYDQGVRGAQNYLDSATQEQVELAGGYGQAWSNGQGEYILSNDRNFDPNQVLRENWREMKPLHD
jgi:hypothetical protein